MQVSGQKTETGIGTKRGKLILVDNSVIRSISASAGKTDELRVCFGYKAGRLRMFTTKGSLFSCENAQEKLLKSVACDNNHREIPDEFFSDRFYKVVYTPPKKASNKH